MAKAMLQGESPGTALAHARGKGKAGKEEARDVSRIMASERVRRVIAGAVEPIRPSDLRRYVLERLVSESEDASEGSVRLRAVQLLGELPGVDVWKPEDAADDVAATGAELAEVLGALEARLSADLSVTDVVEADAVQPEPDDVATHDAEAQDDPAARASGRPLDPWDDWHE
ncbi:hypothetical protein [Planktothrix phage Pag-Yong1]|nr:hypothetical protein [Planktothrix phage Pag-Yong1]WEV89280.1 hypothetical protein [Synechococcus phage MinM2]